MSELQNEIVYGTPAQKFPENTAVGDPAKPQVFAEVPKTEVGAVARVG
jgi:hypothetical protein